MLVWGSSGNTRQQLLAVLTSAVLGAAALAWIAAQPRWAHTPLAFTLGLALLVRVVAAQASPLLEDDHHRYLLDGWRTATAADPYRLPPSAFFGDASVPHVLQEALNGINNPDIPTIYGPLLQAVFALAWWIAPGQLAPLQALLLAADMAVLWLLARHGVGARWLLAYAVHPLLLKEAMASAHPDGLLALWLLMALMAWRQGRAVAVGALLGLALGTKVSAWVVLPLLLWAPALGDGQVRDRLHHLRWAGRVAVTAAVTLATLYLPFWLAAQGGSDASALAVFGSHWRFNPLLFRAIEAAVPSPWARPLAALAAALCIAVVVLAWRRQAAHADPPLHLALLCLLLWSPVVNPWYWLWLLPLAVAAGGSGGAAVVAVSVVAALSYLNGSVLAEAGWQTAATPFSVAWPMAVLQLAVLALAWRRSWITQGSRDHSARSSKAPQ